MVRPQVSDNASPDSYVVDTAGADFLAVDVVLGFTDIAVATLKVQESDTISSDTALSSGTDITGLVWGTSTDPDTGATSVLPSDTQDGKIYKAFINLQGRKRYIQLAVTTGNGTTGTALCAIGHLSKLSEGPASATERGAVSNLIV